MSQRRLGWGGAGGVSGPGLPVILVSGGWTRDTGPPATVRLTTSTDQVAVGTATPSGAIKMTILIDDASNNAVTDLLALTHTTTGAAASGIGTGVLFLAENAGGAIANAARIAGILTTATAGAEVSALDIYTRTGGGALAATWRFDGVGALLPAASGQDLGSPSQRPDIFVRGVNTGSRRVTAAGANNITATDVVVIYNATTGNQAPTLPDVTANPGMHVWINREAADVSGNTVTVTPQGGQTIGGAATRPLAANQSLHLFAPSSGTDWTML